MKYTRQLLLLRPAAAKRVANLSALSGRPKQSLFRDAIANYLAEVKKDKKLLSTIIDRL